MPKAYVGIDLGTTNTTCAVAEVLDDGTINCRQINLQQLDSDPATGSVFFRHDDILPSVVWLADADQVYTGAFCLAHADVISQHDGSKVIHAIKSELANRHWSLAHNGSTYKPAEISSCLLRTVWLSVSTQLDLQTVEGVIITIPASFSSTMRRQTLRGARMAGLPMAKVSLLDEPIAAVFSDYTSGQKSFPSIDTNEPILVFDMGGGTVDVTALSIAPAERVVHVHSTSRYNQVAGDDLDLEIAAYLWRRLNQTSKLSRASALALLRAGEAVKRAVNEVLPRTENGNASTLRDECSTHELAIGLRMDLSPDISGTHDLSLPVAEVLDIVLPFLSHSARTTNFGRNIFTPIYEALSRAGLNATTVKQVYLVGGGANFYPVELELRSFFRGLSRALDPSYSVSRGAAKFAALSGSLGWRVSETTSERIFLRRRGQAFLEVLPDKLPIPSDPRPPAQPLAENHTIELTEETLDVGLEFYQGSEDNDPQMTPIYDVTLRFNRPLAKGTVMHSMVGNIDADKIYRFEIGLREPDGHELRRKVEFSADSSASTDAQSPAYLLNKRKPFEELLQRDPLRTLLARGVVSRVRVLGQRTAAAATTQEPLHVERNSILHAMNESWADAYIGDKYLPTRMRATLSDLQDLQFMPGVDPTNRSHVELLDLYKDYGPVIVRSLLDHSFLLYGTHGLKQKLAPLVDALADDVRTSSERAQLLLSDLDHHADTPYDVVRTLVHEFLAAVKGMARINQTILAIDAPYTLPFKLLAARELCSPQEAAELLIALLKQQLAFNPQGEEFERKVRPIVATLVRTGDHGFEVALDAFEQRKLGDAGSLVLGCFGETLYRWAVHLPKLKPWYVSAVVQAVERIESRAHRHNLLELLVDKWSKDRSVWQRAQPLLVKRPRLLQDAGLPTISGTVVQPTAPLKAEMIDAATNRDEIRLRLLQKRHRELIVNAMVDALPNLSDEAATFLLDVYTSNARSFFVRDLVKRLLDRRTFNRLTDSGQLLVIRQPFMLRFARVERLKGIQETARGEAQTELMRLIGEKIQLRD